MNIRHIFFRIQQFTLSVFMLIYPIREPKVMKGKDCIYKLPAILQKEHFNHILLVTTKGFIKRGSLQLLLEDFQKNHIEVTLFQEVNPDPTIASVEAGVLAYQSSKSQCIVAIGGGSVIDCAKAIAARIAKPTKSVQDMSGMMKINAKLPTLFAIPTTAGTGSECTAGAVITDETNHYKHPIMDFSLIPQYAFLDPALSCSLPANITAATGMDALTHAIEAYTNRFASAKTKRAAKITVKLVYQYLVTAYKNGENLEARENLLNAAYYGGISLNHNYVGYVHAITHALGGLYGIPHGNANATVLPIVLRQYGHQVYKPLAELADIINITGSSLSEKANNFIYSIECLNQSLDIPSKIEPLEEKDYDTIITRALKEANPTYPVPVIWERKDFMEVLPILYLHA